MPQSTRNSKRNRKGGFDVGMAEICLLLKFVYIAAGSIGVIAILGLLAFNPSPASRVAYILTIASCTFAFAGSLIGSKWISKKDKELTQNEMNALLTKDK